MASSDLTVLGAGIFGLSCAWACVQRGAKVRVIDPYGVGAGSSGGVVGALAPHVPENWNAKKAFQLDSLLMAADWWAGVDDASGLSSGYGRLGRVQPLADDRAVDLARARESSARELWGDHAKWRVSDAPGDFAPLSPTGLFVIDTLSARMHPRMACAALAGALQARGVEIVADSPHQGAVLHATGIKGLEAMSQEAGRMIGVGVKGQAALLRYDAGLVPQVFADGVHIVPHADGSVAIGSTSEREYSDPGSTDDQLDTVIAKARGVMPILADAAVIERWAGVRPRAKSRAPMLGAWPGKPGEFIANGGFKIGFGMAPKVGEVMADLILEGRDAIPDGFRAEALFA